MKDPFSLRMFLETPDEATSEELEQLLEAQVAPATASCTNEKRIDGVVVGTLVAFADDGTVPLVTYPGQPTAAALRALTTLDLHSVHIGKPAVLVFEHGDPTRPIIVGCLHDAVGSAWRPTAGHIEVEADGQRIVVAARDRLVLRCGKASITLTQEGKVILEGEYVSSRSSGVLRLKGGSVQIN